MAKPNDTSLPIHQYNLKTAGLAIFLSKDFCDVKLRAKSAEKHRDEKKENAISDDKKRKTQAEEAKKKVEEDKKKARTLEDIEKAKEEKHKTLGQTKEDSNAAKEEKDKKKAHALEDEKTETEDERKTLGEDTKKNKNATEDEEMEEQEVNDQVEKAGYEDEGEEATKEKREEFEEDEDQQSKEDSAIERMEEEKKEEENSEEKTEKIETEEEMEAEAKDNRDALATEVTGKVKVEDKMEKKSIDEEMETEAKDNGDITETEVTDKVKVEDKMEQKSTEEMETEEKAAETETKETAKDEVKGEKGEEKAEETREEKDEELDEDRKEVIPAVRAVLAARSPFFQRRLYQDDALSPGYGADAPIVTLDNVSTEEIRVIVRYCHTNEIVLGGDTTKFYNESPFFPAEGSTTEEELRFLVRLLVPAHHFEMKCLRHALYCKIGAEVEAHWKAKNYHMIAVVYDAACARAIKSFDSSLSRVLGRLIYLYPTEILLSKKQVGTAKAALSHGDATVATDEAPRNCPRGIERLSFTALKSVMTSKFMLASEMTMFEIVKEWVAFHRSGGPGTTERSRKISTPSRSNDDPVDAPTARTTPSGKLRLGNAFALALKKSPSEKLSPEPRTPATKSSPSEKPSVVPSTMPTVKCCPSEKPSEESSGKSSLSERPSGGSSGTPSLGIPSEMPSGGAIGTPAAESTPSENTTVEPRTASKGSFPEKPSGGFSGTPAGKGGSFERASISTSQWSSFRQPAAAESLLFDKPMAGPSRFQGYYPLHSYGTATLARNAERKDGTRNELNDLIRCIDLARLTPSVLLGVDLRDTYGVQDAEVREIIQAQGEALEMYKGTREDFWAELRGKLSGDYSHGVFVVMGSDFFPVNSTYRKHSCRSGKDRYTSNFQGEPGCMMLRHEDSSDGRAWRIDFVKNGDGEGVNLYSGGESCSSLPPRSEWWVDPEALRKSREDSDGESQESANTYHLTPVCLTLEKP